MSNEDVDSNVTSFSSESTVYAVRLTTQPRRQSPASSAGAVTTTPAPRVGTATVTPSGSGFTLLHRETPTSGPCVVLNSSAATVREQVVDPLSENPLVINPLDPMYHTSTQPAVLHSVDVGTTAPPKIAVSRLSRRTVSNDFSMSNHVPVAPEGEEDLLDIRKIALQQLRGASVKRGGGGTDDGEAATPSPTETASSDAAGGGMNRSEDEFSMVSAASSAQLNDSRRRASIPGGGISSSGLFGGMMTSGGHQIASAQGKLRKASGAPVPTASGVEPMTSEEESGDLVSRTSSIMPSAVLLDKSFDASNMPLATAPGMPLGKDELPDIASPLTGLSRKNSFDQYIEAHVAGVHAARRTIWFRCDLPRNSLKRRSSHDETPPVVLADGPCVAPRHASRVVFFREVDVDDIPQGSRRTSVPPVGLAASGNGGDQHVLDHPLQGGPDSNSDFSSLSADSRGSTKPSDSLASMPHKVTGQAKCTSSSSSSCLSARKSTTPLSILLDGDIPHAVQLAKKTGSAAGAADVAGSLALILFAKPGT